ncbi:MAG TPA: hypothetical protein VHY08_22125 [Bacillota bacterium]|nr:hypothetical protein [Bacillota bacterium]
MVNLYYSKIEARFGDRLEPQEQDDYIFSGHIEIESPPYCDIHSKKISVHCFDSSIGQQRLDIKETDINVIYKKSLGGNLEQWSFEHRIDNPNHEEIIINFSIKYVFFNTQTGKTEEYWDTNDSKNYTVGIRKDPNPAVSGAYSSKAPNLALGKSDIALYSTYKGKPGAAYGSFLNGATLFLKNLTYVKDIKINYESRYHNEWGRLPNPQVDAQTNWIKAFEHAKNGEELWRIDIRKDEVQSQYNLSCTYTYPDGRQVEYVDNNFGENYSL